MTIILVNVVIIIIIIIIIIIVSLPFITKQTSALTARL